MKKRIKIYSLFFIVLFIAASFSSCSDQIDDYSSESLKISPVLKSSFDGYFEWDRVNSIQTKNPYTSTPITLTLPWTKGSTQNIGIPSNWLDANAEDVTYSERYYSREKGWELVYSNLHLNTSSKYFAIYNKYTGILRFFLYEISNGSGYGTTASFWGIATDKPTSLFNFTTGFATGQSLLVQGPSQIITPKGTFTGTNYSGIGYKDNNWYGIELECAYDPSITQNSGHNFYIKGWGVNKITLTGNATTTGSITGTLKTTAPNSSGLNLSLSDMFNKSASVSSMIIDDKALPEQVGKKLDEGIKKNDSFSKGLWNNIKSNASKWISTGLQAGAEKGIAAILSGGGSAIGDAIGGFVNSLIGGKSQESITKVDLSINSTTKISLEGETPLVGWGAISALPVPGSTSNVNDMPLYNKNLGVWNLQETPVVTVNMYTATTWLPISYYCQYKYVLNTPKIVLNPEIASKFDIKNTKFDLAMTSSVVSTWGVTSVEPAALINNIEYYKTMNNSYSFKSKIMKAETASYEYGIYTCKNVTVRVSFDLVDKNNSNIVYSFSKYFSVQPQKGIDYQRNDVYPEGNGNIIPFPI